jgi:hypothetical protein
VDLSAKVHRREIVAMTETQQALYSQIYMHSKSVWTQKQQQKSFRGVVTDVCTNRVFFSIFSFLFSFPFIYFLHYEVF